MHDPDATIAALESRLAHLPCPDTRLKMRVNAKFISNVGDNPLTHLSLTAVQAADEGSENSVFGKYTPCGSLSFSVINEVSDKFEIGDQVYVDLTLAHG